MKRKTKINFSVVKKLPAPGHPAQYRSTNKNGQIEFVTFTHSPEIDLNKFFNATPHKTQNKLHTEKLENSIYIEKQNSNQTSYVVPVVYEGSRTLLGTKRNNKFKITSAKDKKKIDKIFKTGTRIKIKSKKDK